MDCQAAMLVWASLPDSPSRTLDYGVPARPDHHVSVNRHERGMELFWRRSQTRGYQPDAASGNIRRSDFGDFACRSSTSTGKCDGELRLDNGIFEDIPHELRCGCTHRGSHAHLARAATEHGTYSASDSGASKQREKIWRCDLVTFAGREPVKGLFEVDHRALATVDPLQFRMQLLKLLHEAATEFGFRIEFDGALAGCVIALLRLPDLFVDLLFRFLGLGGSHRRTPTRFEILLHFVDSAKKCRVAGARRPFGF